AALDREYEKQPCDDETVKAVAAWAGVKGKLVLRKQQREPDGLIFAAACKAMPNAPDTTIAAIAFGPLYDQESGRDVGEQLRVVALVEAGKVVAGNRSTIEEGAITVMVNKYRIDTARYILSKDVRAFGVVFSYMSSNFRCAEGGNDDYLTLWIREGENLRALFQTNLDGWGMVDGGCEFDEMVGLIERAKMTIAIEKTSSHGFADLAITAQVKQDRCTRDDSSEYGSGYDCQDAGKRTFRRVVKYNGQSYGEDYWWPPADRRRFDCGTSCP
ncbi:MAG: hypothetical protein LBQ75_05425, partial [Zoogloeaceae bacterium]|nr:hypothetical protein [Zoogloeaceae bacterium]